PSGADPIHSGVQRLGRAVGDGPGAVAAVAVVAAAGGDRGDAAGSGAPVDPARARVRRVVGGAEGPGLAGGPEKIDLLADVFQDPAPALVQVPKLAVVAA